jgi:hypothetical protein
MSPKEMVIGEARIDGKKLVQIQEAFQNGLDNAPPPSSGFDIQTFTLVAIEVEFGGFVGSSRTRVTLEVRDGPLSGT